MTTPPAFLFSSTWSSTQPAVCKSLRLSRGREADHRGGRVVLGHEREDVGLGE
jgi:hypothetical protein